MHLYLFHALIALFALALANFICALLLLIFALPAFDAEFFSMVFLSLFLLSFLVLLKPWFSLVRLLQDGMGILGINRRRTDHMQTAMPSLSLEFFKNKPIVLSVLLILALNLLSRMGQAQPSSDSEV